MRLARIAIHSHNMMFAAVVTFLEYLSTNVQSAAMSQIIHREALTDGVTTAELR